MLNSDSKTIFFRSKHTGSNYKMGFLNHSTRLTLFKSLYRLNTVKYYLMIQIIKTIPSQSSLTCVIKVVLGEFSCSVHKIAKVGQQLRVVLQHEILPLEGRILVLRSGIHQIEPEENVTVSCSLYFAIFRLSPTNLFFTILFFKSFFYKIVFPLFKFPTCTKTFGILEAVFIKYNLLIISTTSSLSSILTYHKLVDFSNLTV